MDLLTSSQLETSGMTYDDVAGLLDISDYLLEAELSLSRDVSVTQRKGQLVDLNGAVNTIHEAMSQLHVGQLKNWAKCLENRAKACRDDVRSELAFIEYMTMLQQGEHARTPAA